ncbi:MAG TPA: TOMM precursor leader peptide-binding protein [Gaiellaceae bacterium]|nr:TOMM precursor leader peptide-binding protein [Gaiellaceae bacterium]
MLLLLRDLNGDATIPELPLLKPWYRLVQRDDRVLLEHARAVVVFEGGAARAFLPALLSLLDGSRTVDQICALIGPNVRLAVENALELLARNGLLTPGPRLDETDDRRRTAESLASQAASDVETAEIATRLATTPVELIGDEAPLDELARLLHRSGVSGVGRCAAPGGLVVVGPGGDPAQRNLALLERGGHWLPYGEFDGGAVIVGPLIVPRESACFECFLLRRESTSGCAEELSLFRYVTAAAASRPTLLAAAAAVAAELVVRWIGTRDPSLPGTLFTVEAGPGISISAHTVLRVPRCPACSPTAGLAPPSPWHEARIA